MSFIKRTQDCGSLRKEHVGQEVTLNGWVHRVRDLGGLLFIDLRDRTGLVQVMFDPARHPKAEDLRPEFCLSVTGTIKERDDANKNSKMATGDIEMVADAYTALSPAGTLPFQLNDEAQMDKVNEELRVKHRYLDLRRPAMYRKLAIRAAAIRKIRAYLDDREFLEVETPIFTRSTPEGARDYLVPYRLQPGKFYALPQSPQQYKQLLMVAGIERYYQIAKCFRDEAQRADRQPEFTQLDLEMSFVNQEDILQLMEGMTVSMINELIEEFGLEKEPITGFERMTYDEALERYGSDKPDLRFGLQLFDITEVVAESEFGVFKNCAASGGRIRGVLYPGGAALSRKDVSGLEDIAKAYGAKGLATIAVESEEEHGEAAQQIGGRWVRSSILKFLSETELDDIIRASEAGPGDLICLVADQWKVTCEALNRIRLEIGKRADLIDKRKLSFAFILDFPLVEWNAEEERWDPSHHPFTSPKTEDLIYIDVDPGKMRADCYDVVCNGVEWASGSIRIHRPDIQSRIFKLIGVGEEEQKSRFGHILEAFSYGAPPHGGIAPGIDRLVMFLTDEENIREVMAFPKVGQGLDPMMGAPSEVDEKQWDEMGLAVVKKAEPEPTEKA